MPAAKLMGIVALGDLLTGIVLALVGVSTDSAVLTVVGVVLLLCGAGVLAWSLWARSRPETL